ncbi:hypothetical protein MTP09_05470 [Chryseobacterium suipulveris]|uniref:Thymosin beta n=1 Tax=Chryseobacterium suipulveris TaxID=2929800 RepID=A0ABY4BWN1_9FLAO|nr:hypothetical protein [Chryseobacterium suipulveris]UOE42086.1 hypothetical protein MTP09_05470 [Chryseobacterium suipulveris]
MENTEKDKKPTKAEIKKQNQDFPNIPASSEKVHSEKTLKKEVHESSKLHDTGKTDNTESES